MTMARRYYNTSQVIDELFMDSGSDYDPSDEDADSDETMDYDHDDVNDVNDADDADDAVDEPVASTSTANHVDNGSEARPIPTNNVNETDVIWRDGINRIRGVPDFTARTGVQVQIDPEDSPLKYFELFVDDTLWEQLVEQTNLYAQQVIAHKGDTLKKHSPLSQWKPVTLTEMKTFFGLLFLMGIIEKPDIRSYWSVNPMLSTPFFGKCMSRNRFDSILTAFHVNDNTQNLPRNSENYDKVFKIRPLLTHMEGKFGSVYFPKQNISIDESMMPWRGRVEFRQFIPSKPIRYGLKLYLCCDSDTSYVCQMEIYTGKKGNKREVDHGPNVVKRLLRGYEDKGYTVFIDSFFSSVPLVEDLYKKGITAVGTIRKDRKGLPLELKQKKVKKGDASSVYKTISSAPGLNDGTLTVTKFNDRKEVTLLSTRFSGEVISTGKRDRRTGEEIQKPKMVHEYNQHMNGVDTFDQNIKYYSFNRKTWKWWKRAAFHLMHLAKVQAYLVYNIKNPQKKKTQLEFTQSLIEEMTKDAEPPAAFQRRVSDPPERLKERHFLTRIPQSGTTKYPSRVCVVCSKRKTDGPGYETKKVSRYECTKCNKGLCIETCFQLYHSRMNYKVGQAADQQQ